MYAHFDQHNNLFYVCNLTLKVRTICKTTIYWYQNISKNPPKAISVSVQKIIFFWTGICKQPLAPLIIMHKSILYQIITTVIPLELYYFPWLLTTWRAVSVEIFKYNNNYPPWIVCITSPDYSTLGGNFLWRFF